MFSANGKQLEKCFSGKLSDWVFYLNINRVPRENMSVCTCTRVFWVKALMPVLKKKKKYASWSSLIKTGMFDRFVILELRQRPTRSPDRNVAIRRSQIMFMISIISAQKFSFGNWSTLLLMLH